jgi:hypothetical protein
MTVGTKLLPDDCILARIAPAETSAVVVSRLPQSWILLGLPVLWRCWTSLIHLGVYHSEYVCC